MSTTHREIYLDNAATTQPYAEVVDVVSQVMREGFGNASAIYRRGARARDLLESSRYVVAEALGTEPEEVFFTSGGTESNNLAIVGGCKAARAEDSGRIHLVGSALEHPSVTKTLRGMKREGWDVSYVPAPHGEYSLKALVRSLDSRTALVTTMSVQNELGYIFPIRQIVEMRDEHAPQALVHTDGVQAFGKIPFQPHRLGVDLASISGHKIGGPQGIGALFVKAGTPMFTNAFGGGQERGLRSGTEPIALIAGFAQAVEISCGRREACFRRIREVKAHLLDRLLALRPDTVIHSRDDGSPYIVSFSIPGVDHREAMLFLDSQGVCVSKASACSERHPDVPVETWRPKHPLSLEMAGVPPELINSTFRISFSQETTIDEVDRFIAVLGDYLSKE